MKNYNTVLYQLIGLPKSLATDKVEVNPAVKERLNLAIQKILNSKKSGKIFVSGSPIPIIERLSESIALTKELVGIDFAKYFADKLSKTSEGSLPTYKRFVIIYNVGFEEAINTNYSAQLLKSLVKRYVEQGSWVFVVSDTSYTEFNKKYYLDFKNKIKLPDIEEEAIF